MARELWLALEKDTGDRQPLAQVATWAIGEYGESLLNSSENVMQVSFVILFHFYSKNLLRILAA